MINWIIGIGAVVCVLVVGLTLWRVAGNPAFWYGFLKSFLMDALPKLAAEVMRRKTPEEEARWRHEELSGVKPPPKGTGVTTGKVITQPAMTRKGKQR